MAWPGGLLHSQTIVESTFTGEASNRYSDAANWSPPEVPNNSEAKHYSVTIGRRVTVDSHARISDLTLDSADLYLDAVSLTVDGTTTDTTKTTIFRVSATGVKPATLDAGFLSNFSGGTLTGTYFLHSYRSTGHFATLQFNGADIVVLENADLSLAGGLSRVVDEFGTDAIRNLAHIDANSRLRIGERNFATAGDFRNDGELKVDSAIFEITGLLSNFDPATRTLTGGIFDVSGENGAAVLKFKGADIVHNAATIELGLSARITDEAGNNALRNFSNNRAEGTFRIGRGGQFTLRSDLTNSGTVSIASGDATGPYLHIPDARRYRQVAGATGLAGGVIYGNVYIDGGVLSGSGTFYNGGSVVVGDLNMGDAVLSLGELWVRGSVYLGHSTVFAVSRREGDFSNQLAAALIVSSREGAGGIISLDGILEMHHPAEFPVASDAVLNLVQAKEVRGVFRNAPDGARLTTTDGRGSFQVRYEPTKVILTGYQREPPAAQLVNISTRAHVQRDDGATIAGFIVYGTDPKKVVVRGIGPSLEGAGAGSALEDPVIELHATRGGLIVTNDNWKDSQEEQIRATGLMPADERESAVVATLAPGSYTAVLRGKREGTGVALVEVYDVATERKSKLANISTRGFVDADNLLIGGFIAGSAKGNAELWVRGLGPQLQRAGIRTFLPDPMLELRDSNGELHDFNDDNPAASHELPYGAKDAALSATVPPGHYTAILRGKGDDSGIALVEIYDLNR